MKSLLLALVLALPLAADDLSDRLDRALESGRRPPASAAGDQLYQQKEFEKAAEAYLQHLASMPADSNTWYNLACCLSLAGRKDDAMKALEEATRRGFTDVEHMKTDTDLDPLRKRKSFKALMKKLEAAAGAKPLSIWVESKAMLPCHVRLPENYEEKKAYGLVLLLHGRGDNAANFLKGMGDVGGDDFIVAALEGPYLLGAEQNHIMHCWSPWESGQEIARAAYELSANAISRALKQLGEAYTLDGKRIYLMGFSEGGFMSSQAGLKYGDRIAGFVCIGGGLDGRVAKTADFSKLKGKRILVAHGVDDATVPWAEGKALSSALEEKGVENELLPYRGGHSIPQHLRGAIKGWLRGEEIPEEVKEEEPG